jgi:hypothetical protein
MPLTPFADGPGNVASGLAVYNNDLYLEALANGKEAAFATWKTVLWGGATLPTAGAGGTFLMYGGASASANANVLASAANGSAALAFYMDPANDWSASPRTTKMRIRWNLDQNGVAPATNYSPGLYPATIGAGGSGVAPNATPGTLVAGSNATFTAPGTGTQPPQLSTEFNAPAAGRYIFAVVIGGAMAAGSQAIITAQLQIRQV